jgi:HAD superfamily hydrolase (TIGR01484 family)
MTNVMLITAMLTPKRSWSRDLVKIEAIFSDYDGTLCPLELRREDAFISPRLRRILVKASKSIPIGIVTTKDLAFIQERVPFAKGIAATCGLEVQVGEKITLDERIREPKEKFDRVYRECLKRILQIHDNVAVERKETDDGALIGFCFDWRLARDWPEAQRRTTPLLSFCKEQGMYVVESNISPFANVFPMEVSKGEAFSKLRKEMDVKGPIMYLGDSEVDNPAFQLADVSVGIKHRRIAPELSCKHWLEFLELDSFLSDLIEANFDFQEGMIKTAI